MPGVAPAAVRQQPGGDVLGLGDADGACIADVVHISARHFAHQRQLLDRAYTGALL